MSENPSTRSLETAIVADRLALVAMVLFGIYLVSVLVSVLPPKLLDPIWQLASTKVAVEAAPLPLLGLILFHLAAHLRPGGLQLQRQGRWPSQKATQRSRRSGPRPPARAGCRHGLCLQPQVAPQDRHRRHSA